MDEARVRSDHTRWLTELEGWRQDLSQWRDETGRVFRDMSSIVDDIEKMRALLDDHAGTLAMQEDHVTVHEQALVDRLGTGGVELDRDLLVAHEKEASRQEELRERHQRLREQRDALRTQLTDLTEIVK